MSSLGIHLHIVHDRLSVHKFPPHLDRSILKGARVKSCQSPYLPPPPLPHVFDTVLSKSLIGKRVSFQF